MLQLLGSRQLAGHFHIEYDCRHYRYDRLIRSQHDFYGTGEEEHWFPSAEELFHPYK